MWNFLKKMRYVQFDRCEVYWKSLLAANWSWRNYTEQYICDCNLLSYSYIFGLIHVYSHSILSSNPRAKGAVVPWCRKERLRRRIFDSWSLVLFFFWIWHHHNSYISYVRGYPRRGSHSHPNPRSSLIFSFLPRCTLGRLRAFHPSQDLPRKDPEGGLWESAEEFDQDW